jgi:2-polyprenyl-6-hydroxyphenyl methylase/3-demethylubiquinone-9 3-methyltransferase
VVPGVPAASGHGAAIFPNGFGSQLEEALARDCPSFMPRRFRDYQQCLNNWNASGLIPVEAIAGRKIWDLECGHGIYSAVLSLRGASFVLGSDTFLDDQTVPACIRALPNMQFERGSVLEMAARLRFRPDLIFFHNSSEHVADLPQLLCCCADVLLSGGLFFIAHDNYYQPVGHHDQFFLRLNPDTQTVEFQGVKCWESAARCEASREHRERMAGQPRARWDDDLERRLSPQDCRQCVYWKRSRPWAHLIYQSEFGDLFPQRWFHTVRGGSLNKLTLFQVRQFMIEAGFEFFTGGCSEVRNEIPPELLGKFSENELRAFQFTSLYRKR